MGRDVWVRLNTDARVSDKCTNATILLSCHLSLLDLADMVIPFCPIFLFLSLSRSLSFSLSLSLSIALFLYLSINLSVSR